MHAAAPLGSLRSFLAEEEGRGRGREKGDEEEEEEATAWSRVEQDLHLKIN